MALKLLGNGISPLENGRSPGISIIFAFGYCLFVVLVFNVLFDLEIKDRENYYAYSKHSWSIILNNADYGLFYLVFNEPVWLLINSLFAFLFGYEYSLAIIQGFSSFLVAYAIARRSSVQLLLLLIVLFSPAVLSKFSIHLRQGLGIAIFFYGLIYGGLIRGVKYCALAALVHSSFFFIGAILMAAVFMNNVRFGRLTGLIYSVIVVVLIMLGFNLAIDFFPARQIERFVGAPLNVSSLGFIFWAFAFGLLIFSSPFEQKRNLFSLSLIALYLGLYFVSPISARVMESGLILIWLSLLGLTGKKKILSVLLLIFSFSVSYFMRLGSPGLGYFWV